MLLYPHAKLPDALTLKVVKARLLTSEISVPIDDNTISLRDRPLDDSHMTLEVRVAVSGPEDDLNDYLLRHGDISATLTAHCGPSNLRHSIALKQESNATEWYGEMRLDRRLLRGITKLKAVLTGTQKNRPYRYLGATDVVEIISDDAAGSHQAGAGLLDVRWADFKAQTEGVLRDNADFPSYVDLTTEPRPTLYLNAGFRGLKELFPDKERPSGSRLPLNEVMTVTIVRSAFQAMAASAFAEIEPDSETREPGMPGEWKGQIIRELLPELYAGVGEAEALRMAYAHFDEGGSIPAFQSSLLAAINRRLREGRALRTALNLIDRLDTDMDAEEE